MPRKTKAAFSDVFTVGDSAASQHALDSVFPETEIEQAAKGVVKDIGRTYAQIPVNTIVPNPHQPRKIFDPVKLQELADSILEEGLLEPLILRRSPDREGIYEIAAGERRWRAAQLAGLATVSCELLETCSDDRMKRIALIENILREQLTPLELAHSYQSLLDERDGAQKALYTIRSLAAVIKQTKDHVDSHVALLRVPAEVRQLIEDDPSIPVRIIREVGGVEDEADRALLVKEVRSRLLNQADVLAILQESKLGKRRKRQAQADSALDGKNNEQELTTSPIARAVLRRKLQREQGHFVKSLQTIEGDWKRLDDEGRLDVRTHLEQMLEHLQGLLQRYPHA